MSVLFLFLSWVFKRSSSSGTAASQATQSGQGGELGTGAIAGIIVGCVLGLAVIAAVVGVVVHKMKSANALNSAKNKIMNHGSQGAI